MQWGGGAGKAAEAFHLQAPVAAMRAQPASGEPPSPKDRARVRVSPSLQGSHGAAPALHSDAADDAEYCAELEMVPLHEAAAPSEACHDEAGERAPFLPAEMLMPKDVPRNRSMLIARSEKALAHMLRHGCARQALMLGIIFLTLWLVFMVFVLPVVDERDRARLKVPNSLAEVQELYKLLGEYKSQHYNVILLGFVSAYLSKQTLALPGSPLFNLLGGALFGVPVGFVVCLFCTSLGTALCYFFFHVFGGPVVRWLFLEQLVRLDQAVHHHRRRLFYYLTVIRIFPMTPNFFINLAAPLIRLPLVPHIAAATLGLSPITFLTVQAGKTLVSMHSLKDAVDKKILFTLGGLAVIATIPLFLRRRVQQQLEHLSDTQPVEMPAVLRAEGSLSSAQ